MHGSGCAWQGACMAGGHAWQSGGMHGGGAWQGGDMCGRGCVAGEGHAWHMASERAVFILLECILVAVNFQYIEF